VNPMGKTSWPAYAVGAGIGALSCFTFATAKKPIGVTTPFESTAAALGQKLAPGLSGVNAYLENNEDVPKLDWEWMLALGVVLGSFLSARTSGDRDSGLLPTRWARRFGPAPSHRYVGAFLGGALMMFGARMAKGCTSGHGISGALQLAGSSWVFTPIMATSAALVARALFGKGAR
jgi:uncharacterized protein